MNREIEQIHNNQVIKVWPTAKDASIVCQTTEAQIISCCEGKRIRAGGFYWRYKR